MGARFPNARRIKIHRNYTIEEIARVLAVHKNTVRRWQKAGLRALDNGRPQLFHGTEIRRFLGARRQQVRRPCPAGHLYCFRCRQPKAPLGAEVDLLPLNASAANLCGLCACGTLMYRRVSRRTLAVARRDFIVTIPKACSRIGDKDIPPVNGDFNDTWSAHLDAQRQE
jgi:excisionase family DNA binding protein